MYIIRTNILSVGFVPHVVRGHTFHVIIRLFLLREALECLVGQRFVLSRGCNGPSLTGWRKVFLEKSIIILGQLKFFASFYGAWSKLECSWELTCAPFLSQMTTVYTLSVYSKVYFNTHFQLWAFHWGLRLNFYRNLLFLICATSHNSRCNASNHIR
jgi:hypothetical protein